jgi:hypothetical protein
MLTIVTALPDELSPSFRKWDELDAKTLHLLTDAKHCMARERIRNWNESADTPTFGCRVARISCFVASERRPVATSHRAIDRIHGRYGRLEIAPFTRTDMRSHSLIVWFTHPHMPMYTASLLGMAVRTTQRQIPKGLR